MKQPKTQKDFRTIFIIEVKKNKGGVAIYFDSYEIPIILRKEWFTHKGIKLRNIDKGARLAVKGKVGNEDHLLTSSQGILDLYIVNNPPISTRITSWIKKVFLNG